jgi:hypothetical protein
VSRSRVPATVGGLASRLALLVAIVGAPGLAALGLHADRALETGGKTTLIEQLIPALARRGYRVATIKHHHHGDFQADHPGKDSWRHAEAGAIATALGGTHRLAVFQRVEAELSPDQIAPPPAVTAGRTGSPGRPPAMLPRRHEGEGARPRASRPG